MPERGSCCGTGGVGATFRFVEGGVTLMKRGGGCSGYGDVVPRAAGGWYGDLSTIGGDGCLYDRLCVRAPELATSSKSASSRAKRSDNRVNLSCDLPPEVSRIGAWTSLCCRPTLTKRFSAFEDTACTLAIRCATSTGLGVPNDCDACLCTCGCGSILL